MTQNQAMDAVLNLATIGAFNFVKKQAKTDLHF